MRKKYEDLPPDLDWYTYLTEDFKRHRSSYRFVQKAVFDCPQCGGTDVVRIGHVAEKIKVLKRYVCSGCRKRASAARARAAGRLKHGQNPGSTPQALAKQRATILNKYGVPSTLMLPEIRAKGIKAAAEKKAKNRKHPYDLSTIDKTKGSYISQYSKLRRKQDPYYKLQCSIRGAFGRMLLGFKVSKSSIFREIGYTAKELKEHIERQFEPGMTWDNYGKWHVDHIKPLFTFDCRDLGEVKKANALENLRPLWAKENLKRPRTREGLKKEKPPKS